MCWYTQCQSAGQEEVERVAGCSSEARLLTWTVNGKERQVLTSITDPLRFPASELMEP